MTTLKPMCPNTFKIRFGPLYRPALNMSLLLAAMSGWLGIALAQASSVNLALGKPYQLKPAPNYRYCTDQGDRTQLTDGQYVSGYFWTQPGTVGWSGQAPILITLDLGKAEPIGGLSFNTAAGVAGVNWPTAIFVLVSNDSQQWHLAGDLVPLSLKTAAPPASGYALYRYQTRELATHGRFVKLVVVPSGSYAFVDEIEVYRGSDELLTRPLTGPTITDVQSFYVQTRIDACLRRRLSSDLEAVTETLHPIGRAHKVAESLKTELKSIAEAIPATKIASPEDFTTIFPINDLHRRIFAVQAGIWRALGLAGIVVWQNNRWDMLSPTAAPIKGKVAIDVTMMGNEYRSAAFNLSNAGETEAAVTLVLEGLPGGMNPGWITVHEVPFTDTQSGVPVAAALPVVPQLAGQFGLRIPAGLTRQVWLTFHPETVPAGKHSGQILIQSAGMENQTIPIHLSLAPLRFPDQPTLHLGGWDYTDRERIYEVTPQNRGDFIRYLREHFVDSPWAQGAVLARGQYDAGGRMTEPPSPAEFRTWLDRWPHARNYYVFVSVGERFAGFQMGTPAFRRAVTDWINWWAGQLKQWHVPPHELGLLLVDEPHSREQDRIIVEYAKVIRAAQPDVVIWEDPTWPDPTQATPELFELSDVLCPNLPMWISRGQSFADFYVQQRQAGRRLWFYSCSGPGRLLDPYSYHRMQPWFCWKYGAEGAGYWAFGDSNGASSWNEYASQVGAYTPLFLDRNSVTSGKHFEAIREGVEDFEYLCLLRKRVEALERQGVQNGALKAARTLLNSAADRVTGGMTSATLIYWKAPKNRSVADQVRGEILEALMRLGTQ